MKNKITDSDKRLYELNYLVPLRDSDKIAEIAKKISDYIEKRAGALVETEKEDTPEAKGGKSAVWVEKKRLAYPIKNDKGGFYLNSWFKIEPAHLDDLRRFLKLEKEIIRYEILTETNITSTKPTKESVKLANVDALASKNFESPNESKPRYQERPVEVTPKEKIIVEKSTFAEAMARLAEADGEAQADKVEVAEKAPEIAPQITEKPEKIIAEAAESTLEGDEIEKEIPKTMPDKPKKTLKQKHKIKEQEVKETAAMPEIEITPEEEIEKLSEEKESPEISEIEEKEEKKNDKLKKPKKISLEDLDKRLDDILNEEIL